MHLHAQCSHSYYIHVHMYNVHVWYMSDHVSKCGHLAYEYLLNASTFINYLYQHQQPTLSFHAIQARPHTTWFQWTHPTGDFRSSSWGSDDLSAVSASSPSEPSGHVGGHLLFLANDLRPKSSLHLFLLLNPSLMLKTMVRGVLLLEKGLIILYLKSSM